MRTCQPRIAGAKRSRRLVVAIIAGAAALSLGVAPPAGAEIAMSPDIMRGLCRKAGGHYIESPSSYRCGNLAGGASVWCAMGVKSSRGCTVNYPEGKSEPPLPGFPPRPETNAPAEPAPAGAPTRGPDQPPTRG